MYELITTGEVWQLDHKEKVGKEPYFVTVYVFTNGERWAEDLFYKFFRKVESSPTD